MTVLGAWSRTGEQVPVGRRVELEGESIAGLVARTRRPARIRDYERAGGPAAALSRELGMRSAAGAPIVVDQASWGVMNASVGHDRRSRRIARPESKRSPSSSPRRSPTPRRDRDGAARRRAGRLAARRDPGRARVTRRRGVRRRRRGGASRRSEVEITRLYRYEADGTATLVADAATGRDALRGRHAGHHRGPQRGRAGPSDRTARPPRRPRRRHRPAGRRDAQAGIRSAVGTPIVVGDRLWGVIIVASREPAPLPPSTESRIARVHRAGRDVDLERRRRGRSSRRRGRGWWRRPTRSAGGWCATCTTERSSAWSTRSSR